METTNRVRAHFWRDDQYGSVASAAGRRINNGPVEAVEDDTRGAGVAAFRDAAGFLWRQACDPWITTGVCPVGSRWKVKDVWLENSREFGTTLERVEMGST